MTKSGIVLILTLLVGGLAGYLQRGEATSRRALPQIDSVAVDMSPDGRRLQISGSHAEDCAAPLQSVVNAFTQNLDIQLYQDIPSTAVCGLQAIAFEIELALDAAAETSAIIINDQAWLPGERGKRCLYPVEPLPGSRLDQTTLTRAEDGELSAAPARQPGRRLPTARAIHLAGDGRRPVSSACITPWMRRQFARPCRSILTKR